MEEIKAGLLIIGDEILNGRTIDANGTWLSKFLFSKGIKLASIQICRDNKSEIATHLRQLHSSCDLIFSTGGIGPTKDDLTKGVMANFFKKEIVPNDEAKKIVEENYIRFGRVWNSGLNDYHLFPQDFMPIKNPKGLAPGLCYFDHQKLYLGAPGVPREFQAMCEECFWPLIEKQFEKRIGFLYQFVIRTHSIPEEKIFGEVDPTLWAKLEKFGSVSSLPHTIGVDIVVGLKSKNNNFEKEILALNQVITNSPIQSAVWQIGNKSLPELVIEEAKNKNLTFGFAESCTGGLISSKITDVSGASSVFFGSIISYANEIKEKQLKVKHELIQQYGAVSIECATDMAIGAREALKVDVAISVTGIAGPTGGTPEKPVGTVCIGIADHIFSDSKKFQFPGDRARLKERFSDMALLMLYQRLSNLHRR